MIVNGVPYPIDVKDEETLNEGIKSIDRTSYSSLGDPEEEGFHKEIINSRLFKSDDGDSKKFAIANVTQNMAFHLFTHVGNLPEGKIIWGIKPDFGIFSFIMPNQPIGLDRGGWALYKGYMKYSVWVNGKATVI